MSNVIKNILAVIVFAALGGGGYYFFSQNKNNLLQDGSGAAISSIEKEVQEILRQRIPVEAISFDTDVLTDPRLIGRTATYRPDLQFGIEFGRDDPDNPFLQAPF